VDDSVPAHLRAVLFDFDGTLGDSYPAITASVNHVRALHELAPLTVAEVRRQVGRGAEYLLEHTVPGGNPAEDAAAYRAHHPSVLHSGTRLMPGATEVLRFLHGRGLRVGICSNKPVVFTRDLLRFLGIADLVDVVLGPEDVARPKPAPDMLLAALDRLGVAEDEALYVGDMGVDVQTARAAGVHVWIVPTGSDEPSVVARASPDRILTDLFELHSRLGGPAGA
jgi:phosphoglycolate phosphatase